MEKEKLNQMLIDSVEYLQIKLESLGIDLNNKEDETVSHWKLIEEFILRTVSKDQPFNLTDLSAEIEMPIFDSLEKSIYFLLDLDVDGEEMILKDITGTSTFKRIFEMGRYYPITSFSD